MRRSHIGMMECKLHLLFRLTLIISLLLPTNVNTKKIDFRWPGHNDPPEYPDNYSCGVVSYNMKEADGCNDERFNSISQTDTHWIAEEHYMPYLVTLQDVRYAAPRPFCGGVLIHEEWVLTTAFCLAAYQPHNITVIAGERDFKSVDGREQVIGVLKIIVHKRYDPFSHANDVALLKVSSPFTLNEDVKPLPLTWKGTSWNHMNETCRVSGWGLSRRRMSLVLKQITLKIITKLRCKDMYPSLIARSMFCAVNEENQNVCLGDWGAPLVCGDDLVGITSWSNGCQKEGLPVVFISVRRYIRWIKRHIAMDSRGLGLLA